MPKVGRNWIAITASATLTLVMVAIVAIGPEEKDAVRLVHQREGSPPLKNTIADAVETSIPVRHIQHPATPGNWASTTAADNLGNIYSSARTSGDAEARYTALRLAAMCKSLPTSTPDTGTIAVFESDAARSKKLMSAVTAAREKLAAFCATGDSDAYFDDVRVKRVAIDSPSQHFALLPKSSAGSKLDQWGMVVLSSPQAYPLGVESWLQAHLPRILLDQIKSDPIQLQALRDDLYQRLLGESEEGAVRILQQCAVGFKCGPDDRLSASQWADVAALAAEIEQKIRQQRWDELSPRPPG